MKTTLSIPPPDPRFSITEKITVCIVIPTFNRKEKLSLLLNQLLGQFTDPRLVFQVLVVDDGCTDGTRVMLKREFPGVATLSGTGNWWWTRCINEGIRFAMKGSGPDYFLFLNDDSQIRPGYLHQLMETACRTGKDCIIGSISVTDQEPYRVSFSGVKSINWVSLKKELYYKPFEPLENIPASGLVPTYALNGRGTLVSSSLIQRLGLLNEKAFPQYGSDDDLALRSWKKGYPVWLSYSSHIYDSTRDTSKGAAFRQDSVKVFLASFFTWNSVNYIPKQFRFFYQHGIKALVPVYLLKFIAGTTYAYFFKYKKTTL
jgi:GT2 family glycosyltransferase